MGRARLKISKSKQTLLIIDDDKTLCEALKDEFAQGGIEVITAHTGADGLKICSREKIDVVLLDQKLPDSPGDTLCQPILKYNEQTKIIFITAFPNFDNALKAIKAGAFDYLSKPFELGELHLTIENALKLMELEKVKQLHNYKNDKEKEKNFLVGNFGEKNDILELIDLAAPQDYPLLITGETGVGKNVVAKAVHYKGADPRAPFVGINCAAIPENLVEAELFGYEKGAYTGAVTARKGLFEIADGGTLLLDEIGAMPLHLQAKLLGVLDDGKVKRLGGQTLIPVNVRVIAATNADLETMIAEKTFREDIYYRLSVLRIHIPPLRERPGDIPLLCNFIIEQKARGRNITLPDDEVKKLMNYHWPGNVRELKNIIERSLVLHKNILHPSELLGKTSETKFHDDNRPLSLHEDKPRTLEEVEMEYIKRVLSTYSGNLTRSARVLGISLSTLKRKIKQYGLQVISPGQNAQG